MSASGLFLLYEVRSSLYGEGSWGQAVKAGPEGEWSRSREAARQAKQAKPAAHGLDTTLKADRASGRCGPARACRVAGLGGAGR